MGTAQLTTPSLPANPPHEPTNTGDVAHGVFEGRSWTYRPGEESLLGDVPAGVWNDPDLQPWTCVKQNARREVWRAVVAGRVLYLKYYYRDPWWRAPRRLFRPSACQAEWEGGIYAFRAGIAAIRPIAHAQGLQRGRHQCDLLITEAIEPAQPLSDFWQQIASDDDPQRRRSDTHDLTEKLAEMIARAHQAGFEHLDMHAANILVHTVAPRQYHTVFVDLQSARRARPLSDHAVVRNLAQLNQWFRRHSSIGDRLRFLRAYLRWRTEYQDSSPHGRSLQMTFPQLVGALKQAAHRHAHRLWSQRDRRAYRNGRYFVRAKLGRGWRCIAVARVKHAIEESQASRLRFDRDWWRSQFANPLRWFDGEASTSCKESHSGWVRRTVLTHDNVQLPVILKRPKARNGLRRIVQTIPPSRSERGWRMGHALLHRDLPTARPLAILERRLGPLVLDSILVTEAIPGAVDLESFLRIERPRRNNREWLTLKQELIALLVRECRRLQDRGFHHRDCKASNLLVAQLPHLKLLWIDMDGLRRRTRLSSKDLLRPLVRLHVSLLDVPGLTRTDRVRFLRAYCTRFGKSQDAWRSLWPTLAQASEQKRRAKEARRKWKLENYGRE